MRVDNAGLGHPQHRDQLNNVKKERGRLIDTPSIKCTVKDSLNNSIIALSAGAG